jgi:Tfp pilus assembly protein PilP
VLKLPKNSCLNFAFSFVFLCTFAYGAEPKKSPEEKKYQINDFTYTSKDRRDPFEPVYLLMAKKNKEKLLTKGKKGPVLKGGYELEELKLVGIIRKDKSKYAMMEDLHGRGILFKKGDPINPTTSIMDILESKVVLGYSVRGEMRKFELEIQK